MKIFIGAITFVISVIVVKIVFIVIASPALFIPSISDSSIFHGIIMFTAVIASVCSGVFCLKKTYRYLNKEVPQSKTPYNEQG